MQKVRGNKYLFMAIVLLLCSTVSQAAEFKGIAGFGYDTGGDILLSGVYSDGSTWEVRANEGFEVHAGAVMVTGSFETQATVGYKFGGPQAKNGSVTFDEMPIELMEFYRTGNFRMGMGLNYLYNPRLVVNLPSGSVNGTYKFDNAIGTVVQIGWAPASLPISLDLRYIMTKLKASNVANAKDINGNVLGFGFNYFF